MDRLSRQIELRVCSPSEVIDDVVQVSRTLAGQIDYRVVEDDRLLIFDAVGTLLAEYPWPAPGTKYVGSGNPRGPRGPRKNRGLSEMS